LDLIHNIMPERIKIPKSEPLDQMNNNLSAMIAYILSEEVPNRKLSDMLIQYKFEHDVLTPAIIILKAYNMFKNPMNHDYRIHDISREMKRVPYKSIELFMSHFGFEDESKRLFEHKPKYTGADVAHLGLKGKDISDKLDQMEKENFFNVQ